MWGIGLKKKKEKKIVQSYQLYKVKNRCSQVQ